MYFNQVKIMSQIGENVKELREKMGISQDKLSKLANISSNTVAKLELKESSNPTIDTLQKIAKALNVKVDDIIK